MIFSQVGRVLAILLCAFGLFSIYLGLQILFSLNDPLPQAYGMSVGPKIPLLSQGFMIFASGVALGTLCEISLNIASPRQILKPAVDRS